MGASEREERALVAMDASHDPEGEGVVLDDGVDSFQSHRARG